MLKIEKTDVYGWESAIRGMRNPMNSWDKSDSFVCTEDSITYEELEKQCREQCSFGEGNCPIYDAKEHFIIGKNDHDLMMRLANGGSTHAKYRRMINVTCDITAPLYWWKEFDTYKVGTVANSCSTMHKIHAKEFTLDDFSYEHLLPGCLDVLEYTISMLNYSRELFLDGHDKIHWHQMIQLLPSSYNQKRTVQLNYEVLVGMYRDRRNHKLDEWHTLCDWIRELPYSEIIIGDCE